MNIFSYKNRKENFISEIEKINGLRVSKVYEKQSVIFSDSVSFQSLLDLIKILSCNNLSFAFHDSLYPTSSDPGAYLDYSQEKNDKENCWSMTLGNHGWSGGIYTINNDTIAQQLFSLINKKLLSNIQIEDVSIFSHYEKENSDSNNKMIQRIENTHSSTFLQNVDSLIFGKFNSELLGKYNIYQLTSDKLLVDSSETWHSKRFSADKYIFKGDELSEVVFLSVKDLLMRIPSEILTHNWKAFNSPGNNLEEKLVLKITGNKYGFSREITIDNIEIDTNTLSEPIRKFKILIENKIKEIEQS
jgi:hypothetical protein